MRLDSSFIIPKIRSRTHSRGRPQSQPRSGKGVNKKNPPGDQPSGCSPSDRLSTQLIASSKVQPIGHRRQTGVKFLRDGCVGRVGPVHDDNVVSGVVAKCAMDGAQADPVVGGGSAATVLGNLPMPWRNGGL
jgi:hypothetical protein